MKCSESERLMSALLDGDLETSPRLEAHLVECASCQELFDALLATVVDLEALPVPEVSVEITARVMSALPDASHAVWIRRLALGWGALCATAGMLFLAAGLWSVGLLPFVLTKIVAGLAEVAKTVASALVTFGYGSPGFLINLWLLGGCAAATLLLAAGASRAYSLVTSTRGRGVRQ